MEKCREKGRQRTAGILSAMQGMEADAVVAEK
jgi:hypothetical protein